MSLINIVKYSIVVLFLGLVIWLIKSSNKNKNLFTINQIYIHHVLDEKYDSALIKINSCLKLAPQNALFHAHKGLVYGRKAELSIFNSLEDDTKTEFINEAIQSYQTAISLNPNDDVYYHNIAWLYLYFHQYENALNNINRAIEISPYIAIYHLSKGLFLAQRNHLHEALNEFKIAIRINPVILRSDFYQDVVTKYPQESDIMIKETIVSLESLIEKTNSPIYKSKLGILYFYRNQLPQAQILLEEAVNQLPNLNRPWYFLGKIAENSHNHTLALAYFKKSAYLDPNDYLINLSLGEHYYLRNDTLLAAKSFTYSLYNKLKYPSEHTRKNWKMYKLNTVPNNLLPEQLLIYTNEQFPFNQVFTKLSNLYYELGNDEKSEHYKKLSEQRCFKQTFPISFIK